MGAADGWQREPQHLHRVSHVAGRGATRGPGGWGEWQTKQLLLSPGRLEGVGRRERRWVLRTTVWSTGIFLGHSRVRKAGQQKPDIREIEVECGAQLLENMEFGLYPQDRGPRGHFKPRNGTIQLVFWERFHLLLSEEASTPLSSVYFASF